MDIFALGATVIGGSFLASQTIKIIPAYERAIKFRFGKYSGILQPGLNLIIPFVDRIENVDLRVRTIDVPSQEVMTKDNVPATINGVVFYEVREKQVEKSILKIRDFEYSTGQMAQAVLRDICGKKQLDQILIERESIGDEIQKILDTTTDPWGIQVTDVKLKDIELPSTMKRAMAQEAEAERNRRAKIITADGELQASEKLCKAGKKLEESPASITLRTLKSLEDIAVEKNSTIILPFPSDFISFLKKL